MVLHLKPLYDDVRFGWFSADDKKGSTAQEPKLGIALLGGGHHGKIEISYEELQPKEAQEDPSARLLVISIAHMLDQAEMYRFGGWP
jgi:hypothetical protein